MQNTTASLKGSEDDIRESTFALPIIDLIKTLFEKSKTTDDALVILGAFETATLYAIINLVRAENGDRLQQIIRSKRLVDMCLSSIQQDAINIITERSNIGDINGPFKLTPPQDTLKANNNGL